MHDNNSYLISPPSDQSRTAKIYTTKVNLRVLFKKHRPNVASIEDYSLSLQGASLYQLAEAGGVVRDLLFEFDIPVFSIAPQTLKKFVLGPGKPGQVKGSQAKSLVLMKTYKQWHIEFDNDDMCDAFCVAKFLQQLFFFISKKKTYPKWKVAHFNSFLSRRGESLST